MKKTAAIILLYCLLIVSIKGGLLDVKADSSGPIVFSGGITIYSPVNTTYQTDTLNLNLSCNCGAGLKIYFSYDLDGKHQGPITLSFNVTPGFHIFAIGSALIQLPRLSPGSHRLTVYEDAYLLGYGGANPPGEPFEPTAPGSHDYVASWVATVYFTIDTNPGSIGTAPNADSIPPAIVLLSVENKTYDTTSIPLDFNVNEESQVSYSLDGHDNVTIAGNSTLSELPLGQHTLTLYAKDSAGNTDGSETVKFTIAELEEPFSTSLMLAAAIVGVSIAVSAGFLLYRRKHKHEVVV